ncbi:MAG: glycine zipper 2TM domain-containing protein [Nevskia sp.]
MKNLTAIATAIAVLGVTATAQANHRDDERDYGYGYDDSGDYAEVISSRPIYHDVRISQPRQECYDERVAYDDGYRRGHDNSGIGALLGAVVGGVVGNRFGHGGGRVATTAVGAAIGAGAGASIGRNSGDRGYQTEPTYGYQQRCTTVNDYSVEQRVEGYDVAYRYHGHVYNTRLPYDPGDRLAVNVDVRPTGRW